jgi:hypothetical protein
MCAARHAKKLKDLHRTAVSFYYKGDIFWTDTNRTIHSTLRIMQINRPHFLHAKLFLRMTRSAKSGLIGEFRHNGCLNVARNFISKPMGAMLQFCASF